MLAFRYVTASGFNSKTEHSGFTLLELLIVIVIMSFSAALVGPSLFNQYGASIRASELKLLSEQLRLASQEAYYFRTPIQLKFEGRRMTFIGQIEREGRPQDGYSYQELFIPNTVVSFNSYGIPNVQSLALTSNEKEITLAIPSTLQTKRNDSD